MTLAMHICISGHPPPTTSVKRHRTCPLTESSCHSKWECKSEKNCRGQDLYLKPNLNSMVVTVMCGHWWDIILTQEVVCLDFQVKSMYSIHVNSKSHLLDFTNQALYSGNAGIPKWQSASLVPLVWALAGLWHLLTSPYYTIHTACIHTTQPQGA